MIYLSEICDLMNGYAFKSKDYVENSNTLNCRMSNIRPDGKFDILYNAKYLPDSYAQEYSKYLLKDGDIVIAMTDMANDPKILGVPTIVNTLGNNLLLNQRVGKLIIKDTSRIDISYLRYALSRKSLKSYFKKFAGGGLQLNIGKKEVLAAQIPLPPLQIQKKIVEVLDKAQELIDLRKKQIELLDDLIQSVFYDMFGDPVTNPKEWEKKSLRNCINIAGGYAFKSKEFVESGIPIIKIGTANKGYFDTSTFSFWDKNYDSKLEKYKVIPGDLLITLTGTVGKDDYGNICVADDSYQEYLLNQRVARLDVICEMNRTFIQYCFAQKKFKGELIKLSRGVRQANISNEDIYSLQIIKPNIELQNQFGQTVQKIEEQKELMQQSLLEMENNFNSLMQRSFKGELFNQ